jgi:nucleotidyltransferase substrate binding protein (TIGR01987 family)
MESDIRWEQRFENFFKALKQLESAVRLSKERDLSDLEEQGLIQAFEFTHELAWNVMKDYFYYQGNSQITGSRDATREAFKVGLVTDGDGWMEMLKSRNKTSHTYNQETASDISGKIVNWYFELFLDFEQKMKSIKEK